MFEQEGTNRTSSKTKIKRIYIWYLLGLGEDLF